MFERSSHRKLLNPRFEYIRIKNVMSECLFIVFCVIPIHTLRICFEKKKSVLTICTNPKYYQNSYDFGRTSIRCGTLCPFDFFPLALLVIAFPLQTVQRVCRRSEDEAFSLNEKHNKILKFYLFELLFKTVKHCFELDIIIRWFLSAPTTCGSNLVPVPQKRFIPTNADRVSKRKAQHREQNKIKKTTWAIRRPWW